MNNQVKLIDGNKILSDLVGYIDKFSEEEADATREGDNDRAEEMSGRIELLRAFANGIMTGSYRPDSPPVPTIKPGDTRDAEKILAGVLGEIDKLKLYDSNQEAFKRISNIINGEVVE